MIYWHLDRRALCVYSQLKSCSSSEVAAMIEGLLRHQSIMEIDGNYVDSHGQSEIGFAFTELLGDRLLKRIGAQRLNTPELPAESLPTCPMNATLEPARAAAMAGWGPFRLHVRPEHDLRAAQIRLLRKP